MAPRGREKTPDSLNEPKTRFLAILKEASVDQRIGQQVFAKLKQLQQENAPLEGDAMDWLIPGAYAFAISSKAPNFEHKVVLIKLLKATNMNVTNFYARVRKWTEMAALNPVVRDVISQSERYFQISRTVYERYDQIFLDIFRDPLDPEPIKTPVAEKLITLRRKQKVVAGPKIVQPIDVYVFTWDFFVYIRRLVPAARDDLLATYHLFLCVIDCIRTNVVSLKRPELLNLNSEALPKEAEENDGNERKFSLLPYLCSHYDGVCKDCLGFYVNGFVPAMEAMVKEKAVFCDPVEFTGLLVPENYDKNLNSISSSYDYSIRVGSAVDERVLLVSRDVANPEAGGDPSNITDVTDILKHRRDLQSDHKRKLDSTDFKTPPPVMPLPSVISSSAPLTPASSCSALERREAEESKKTPALTSAVDLVNKLNSLCTGCLPAPSTNLVNILSQFCDNDISNDLVKQADLYREKLVSSYNEQEDETGVSENLARNRFNLAQVWHFKILEDVFIFERSRPVSNPDKLRKLAENEILQKGVFVFATEIVLYAHNCSKMFPWPLDVLELAPFDFVKIIELVVRLEALPRTLVKHFGSVEESILEQYVWASNSPLWAEIQSEKVLPAQDVCWPHALEETPTSPVSEPFFSPGGIGRKKEIKLLASPGPGQAPIAICSANGTEPQIFVSPGSPTTASKPKISSINLFFRKIYILAGARLRDLCDKLGFDSLVEKDHHMFQRMFTLFEFCLTEHITLLRDRHLDQILMCCAYVVAKLESANALDRSFHQIMNAYRAQPQAESRVYRNVLIDPDEEKKPDFRTRSQHSSSSTASDPEEGSNRGDIIKFYNKVFVRSTQGFIAKFSPRKKMGTPGIALSPVPKISSNTARRQIHPATNVYVSPLKRETEYFTPANPGGKVLTFTFGVSGQKDAFSIPNLDSPAKLKKPDNGTLSPSPPKKLRRTSSLSPKIPSPYMKTPDGLGIRINFPVTFSATNPAEGIPPALP
ncbi:retinoblastoma-like protein 2 [Paramacrobiotus metropolitanus]|uniref:retinoblastoma-like protein 2 n=1 Tax=Paramacrobiotus metropolitanus TaxID=2943436 RepID=UPI0024464817|nr:retinoblastoma-like protein 2 [Paramacrobiotus metropolitanus]